MVVMDISGEKIKKRREALKLSRNTLAQRIGVSRNTIYNWESGGDKPSKKYRPALSEALNIDINSLLEGNFSEPTPPYESTEAPSIYNKEGIAPPVRPMKKDIELGKRIARLRTDRDLEQQEAAAGIGIKYHTYQPYEYGRTPSRKNIENIVVFYKCSKSWLLTGEGVPFPDRPADKPDVFSSPSNNVVYLNPANRILDEATAEAGVDLNDAQKAALIKIIQDELTRTGDKVKEIIRVFKKEV